MGSPKINWPEDLRPQNSPVYTYNELKIPAEPQVVWAWLIRAEWWPEWYPYWQNVKFISEPGPDLGPDTIFILRTNGSNIRTVVEEFAPFERLAWRGQALGIHGYHGWIIEPNAGGCKVITEETQRGWLPGLLGFLVRRTILKRHEVWLERLAEVSAKGMPDNERIKQETLS